ncbi:MAG: IS21 family transposase [Chloroflexi bacterium]|nr:IS21 family transposase [Chloroflexota bacterium]
MEDWAEVQRLFHREGLTRTTIARRLGMSRTTVIRLLELREPPHYARRRSGSQLDRFADEIAAMLDADPSVAATVVCGRLRRSGYAGGLTILREHLAHVRPAFRAARAFQRTSYLPGEIVQLDWWYTGLQIPVGKGQRREAFGLVATLPYSGAHAVVFSLSRTMADFLSALPRCLARLGGAADKAGCDNDAAIVARREHGRARLHPEVAALFGALRLQPVVLAPRRPQSKGHVERTIRYLETSFTPLRDFDSLTDLQTQHDGWAAEVAFRRTLRRTGARVTDRWNVERRSLHRLPEPLPDTDLHLEGRASKDAFVRVCGANYSVPSTFVGRRIAIRVSPTVVRLSCEGTEIAAHRRSFVRSRRGARGGPRPCHPPGARGTGAARRRRRRADRAGPDPL